MTIITKPNILAIPGSLRTGSSNHAILKYLATKVPAEIEYAIYDDLALIPPFDPGLDNDSPSAIIQKLRQLLDEASGIIICTPEYAFGVPGQLKNMLDWLVSSGSLVDKPVCLITASSVGENAHASLLLTLGALSANVIKDSCLLIPFVRSKMDGDGKVVDEETIKSLDNIFKSLLNNLSDVF